MVTAEAALTNGTSTPHTNGIVEPKINHTVFPVPEIEIPSSISITTPAPTPAKPVGKPLPTSNHHVFPTPSISIEAAQTSISTEPSTAAPETAITPSTPVPSISIDSPSKTAHTIPSITTSEPVAAQPVTSTPVPSEPASDEPLFSSDLVSPIIAAQLPPTYTIRALKKSDYHIGFLDCLRVLTVVGDVSEAEFNERYDYYNGQGKGGYYLLVIEDGGRVVGTGALIVERKLYVPFPFTCHPIFGVSLLTATVASTT
jgi:hypothetical protein